MWFVKGLTAENPILHACHWLWQQCYLLRWLETGQFEPDALLLYFVFHIFYISAMAIWLNCQNLEHTRMKWKFNGLFIGLLCLERRIRSRHSNHGNPFMADRIVSWTRRCRPVACGHRVGEQNLGLRVAPGPAWCLTPRVNPSSGLPIPAPPAVRGVDVDCRHLRWHRYCACADSWSSTCGSFAFRKPPDTRVRMNRSLELQTTCTRNTAPDQSQAV